MLLSRDIVVIMPKLIWKILWKYIPLFLTATSNRFFFMSPNEHTQLSNLSSRKKLYLEMVFCTIIVVIMPKPIRKRTLKKHFVVPCCDIQQIFFLISPNEHTQLSKLSIWKKLNLVMWFTRNIVVIMPKAIKKITVTMPYSVPCCDIQHIFL